MKPALYPLTLFVLHASIPVQTRFDVTMTVESVERQFIVVRPSAPTPAGGYPVVFMFHGTSGDGERFYNISGWKEKGEREGFVTNFPSSWEHCFLNDRGKPTHYEVEQRGSRGREVPWCRVEG